MSQALARPTTRHDLPFDVINPDVALADLLEKDLILIPKEILQMGQSGQHRIIAGYASTIYPDRENRFADADIMLADAFKDFEFFMRTNPIVRYNHEEGKPIGKGLWGAETDKGLLVAVEIAKDDEVADRIWNLIEQKVLRSFSVLFRTKEEELQRDEKTGDQFRVIKSVELVELAVVDIPANRLTQFVVVKNFQIPGRKNPQKVILMSSPETEAKTEPVAEDFVSEEPATESKGVDNPEVEEKSTGNADEFAQKMVELLTHLLVATEKMSEDVARNSMMLEGMSQKMMPAPAPADPAEPAEKAESTETEETEKSADSVSEPILKQLSELSAQIQGLVEKSATPATAQLNPEDVKADTELEETVGKTVRKAHTLAPQDAPPEDGEQARRKGFQIPDRSAFSRQTEETVKHYASEA